MRKLQIVAAATSAALLASGCALQQREWGSCAVGGGIVGAVAGGVTGGALINNLDDDANDSARAGAIVGGLAGGALVGSLLGHVLCDPLKEAPVVQAKPPPPPPETEIVELRGTHFAFDSARLTSEGEAELAVVVDTMQDHPDLRVRCEGHTDSIGSEAYNQQLGQRRADAVRQHLIDQGIDGDRIGATSFGETRPAADNATEEGRAQNRRVEVIAE